MNIHIILTIFHYIISLWGIKNVKRGDDYEWMRIVEHCVWWILWLLWRFGVMMINSWDINHCVLYLFCLKITDLGWDEVISA